MTPAPFARLRKRARVLAGLAVVAAITSACVAGGDDATSTTTPAVAPTDPSAPREDRGQGEPAPIEFELCGRRIECARVEVPLDHADLDGARTVVAVTRHPATGDRIGTLFVNPGGPGIGAGDLVVELVETAPPVIAERFDIVGVDPRGTGNSGALDCTPNDGDPTVTYPTDLDAFTEYFTALAGECAAEPGIGVLASLTTENAARDIEFVRKALGDEPLSFLGYSYGTAIGQVYASLFPDQVRAMVLDAPVALSLSGSPHDLLASRAETAIQRVDVACAIYPECQADVPSLISAVDEVRTKIDAGELGSELGERDLDRIVRSLVGQPWRLGDVTEALRAALNGDGGPLELIAAGGPDVTATNAGVTCADGWNVAAGTAGELPAQAEATAGRVLGPRWEIPCDLWPVSSNGIPPVSYTGDAPILVVTNRHDPISPFEWAEAVTRAMGPSATLLVAERSQHGATFGSLACIDDQVTAFLVDLAIPTEACPLPGILYMGITPAGIVEGFLPGGPADLAGLEPGDRVIAIDGAPYDSGRGFPSGTAGRELALLVERAGEELLLTAVRWPAEPWEVWQVAN